MDDWRKNEQGFGLFHRNREIPKQNIQNQEEGFFLAKKGQIFIYLKKIEEVNIKKEDNREVSSKFKENQFKDGLFYFSLIYLWLRISKIEKYMKFMAAHNFILLSKPECFKQIESGKN